MEFYEAAQIARQHLGSTLTRDDTGSFVVRLIDGSIISNNNILKFDDHFQKEKEVNLEYVNKIRTEFILREEKIKAENVALAETCTRLQQTIESINLQSAELKQQIEQIKTKNAALEYKISKVSPAEWERIKKAEETEAVARRSERRTVKCSCLGEVENCYRCYGSGAYQVDGYGNPV